MGGGVFHPAERKPVHITFDQPLIDYMRKKGYVGIAVDTVSAIGCCADTTELATRFVKAPEAEKLRAKGCGVHEADYGEVFIETRGLHYDENIRFSLRSFFGAKDIRVKGIQAFRL